MYDRGQSTERPNREGGAREGFIRFLKSTNVSYSNVAVQTKLVQEHLPQSFRSLEDNPIKHNIEDINRFYKIPSDHFTTLFSTRLPKYYQTHVTIFNEMCILIRKPALELLSYIAKSDYTKPVNKYVIFGENGCGKTCTLLHVLHYGYMTKKILVHIPWAPLWIQYPKEVSSSRNKEGFMDLPIDAAAWLLSFKNQNASILNEVDIKLSKTYEWSSEESFLKDSPLINIIDFGITRIKYSCEIVIALIHELKQACNRNKCKVLVAIDGFNIFFSNTTGVKDEMKQMVPASKVSITEAFLNITKSDWCNGEIIVTVDQSAMLDNPESHFPRYLLTKEGFDHLDPFLPIEVKNYSQEEFDTVIEYYKDRKWIRNITPDGQKELKLLSGSNPYKLMDYCKHL